MFARAGHRFFCLGVGFCENTIAQRGIYSCNRRIQKKCFKTQELIRRKVTLTSDVCLRRLQHVKSADSSQREVDEVRVTKVSNNETKRWTDVTWNDGSTTSYPYVWLRDNCQCEKCFHPTTKSRLVLMMDLDTQVVPDKVEVADDGSLKITWPDGHVSPYPADWLKERAFTDQAREKRQEAYGQKHQFWGADLQDKIPTFDFQAIVADGSQLLQWLQGLELYGLALIRDAPQETGQLQKLADKICFTRRTNYGDFFHVMSKVNPSNLAYTNAKLGLHCDLPFYHYVPGVQLLHCVQNEAKGGQNQFADASYAAKIMEEQYPEMYKLLSEKLVDFYDTGEDYYKFHKVARRPNFVRNSEGEVIGVNYNNQVRDTFLNLPIEDVQPIYEAWKKLDDIMYDPKNHVTHTLRSGDIICFDNIRVLHGRDKYDVGQSGTRHLEGAYFDWDEIQSRIRVLKADIEK